MLIKIDFTEDMKYKPFKVTEKKDGRLFCRVPIAYEIDEKGEGKKRYVYKEIYGVDRNDIALKRAIFIDEQVTASREKKATDELFITQAKEWLYNEKYGTVKGTSFDRLEGILLHQIVPAVETLRHYRLKDIDSKDIKAILKYNLDKGYSYSTLLKIYRFLNEFLQHQFLGGVIPRNPVQQVKMYKKEYVAEQQAQFRQKRNELRLRAEQNDTLTAEEQAIATSTLKCEDQVAIQFFTDDEIARLHVAAVATFSNGQPKLKQAEFFIFMLNTGLRAGEALSLKYSDFDYDKRTVTVQSNITSAKERDSDGKATGRRSVKQGSTKTTSSTAVLDINQKAIDIIRRLQAQEPRGYDGYIIHNGDKTIEPRALEKRFYNLLRLARIKQTGLHTLRHTCASKLYELTHGDTKFVSEMLRHKSVSFTAQTYIHLERKYKQRRVNDFAI